MKILAISSIGSDSESMVDWWRVHNPLTEVAKHVDWTIDVQPHLIRDFHGLEHDPDAFMVQYGEAEVAHLGQYDIIFTSYFTSPHVYTLLWGAHQAYGTQFVIDIDDDLYDVDPLNPFHLAVGAAGAAFLRTIAGIAPILTTTTPQLAAKLRRKSTVGAAVHVLPNAIADTYAHDPFDNGDTVVIGYFGGASHYDDLHRSNVLPALDRLLHDYPHVTFQCAGQPIDYPLPTGRYEVIEAQQGAQWRTGLFPSLNYDIAIAPLLPTVFNASKSDIKWQEATRLGAAVVASDVGAYRALPGGTVLTVDNSVQQWYDALKKLLVKTERRRQLTRARVALEHRRIEETWPQYVALLTEIGLRKP